MRNSADLLIRVPPWTPELLDDAPVPDFGRVSTGQTIVLIPRSAEAQDWVALHVPNDWRNSDGTVEVEPSHMTSVLMCLSLDRLSVDEA